MKNNFKKLTLASSALLASTICSQGAITFVGEIVDTRTTTRSGGNNSTPALTSEVIQWSDTTFDKTQDIDGDNRYGTTGVFLSSTTAQFAGQASQQPFSRLPTTSAVVNLEGSSNGNFQNNNGTTGFIQNDANDAIIRLGYTGIQVGGGEAIPLTDLFSFTLNADQAVDETLRLGVFGGTNNNDLRIGFTELQVTAGGIDSSIVTSDRTANSGNAPDLYFFDITGLSAGDEIIISAANSNTTGNNFNTASISGFTLDTAVVPEPSSAALLGLGGLALLLRRRK